MKFIGKINGIGRTLNGILTVTIESIKVDPAAVMKLSQADSLDVEIKKHREKRSLDANSYYWVLCSRLAEAIKVTRPYMHNCLLRRYGQIEMIGGQAVYIVIPDTDEAKMEVDEAQLYHLRPTSQVKTGKDGEMYRTYMMLKGSSAYDTKEMSVLIDGLVSECREAGIETLPPEELERMMAAYGKKIEKRADG